MKHCKEQFITLIRILIGYPPDKKIIQRVFSFCCGVHSPSEESYAQKHSGRFGYVVHKVLFLRADIFPLNATFVIKKMQFLMAFLPFSRLRILTLL